MDILREQGVLAMDAPARHVVAIEDSVWGLQSARDAGLRTVAVTTSYRAEDLGIADLVVPSLDAVTVDGPRGAGRTAMTAIEARARVARRPGPAAATTTRWCAAR